MQIITPNVEMVLRIEVEGRANANHRPRATMAGRGFKQRVRTYLDPAYESWMKKVRAHGALAAHQADYVMPLPKLRLYLLTQFFMTTTKVTRIKKGKREGELSRIAHRIPDAGNLNKGVEDALEGVWYRNDSVVTTLPWPGYPTFVTKVEDASDQKVIIGLAYLDEPPGRLL